MRFLVFWGAVLILFDNMNNKQITNQQQTNNKPTTTTKERKERKERKEEREALAPFDFLKTNYKEEINNIIKDNRLNNVQLELCINKFNKRRVKNLNVLDFKNYIMNWSDNINKNNSQISNQQQQLKKEKKEKKEKKRERHSRLLIF